MSTTTALKMNITNTIPNKLKKAFVSVWSDKDKFKLTNTEEFSIFLHHFYGALFKYAATNAKNNSMNFNKKKIGHKDMINVFLNMCGENSQITRDAIDDTLNNILYNHKMISNLKAKMNSKSVKYDEDTDNYDEYKDNIKELKTDIKNNTPFTMSKTFKEMFVNYIGTQDNYDFQNEICELFINKEKKSELKTFFTTCVAHLEQVTEDMQSKSNDASDDKSLSLIHI